MEDKIKRIIFLVLQYDLNFKSSNQLCMTHSLDRNLGADSLDRMDIQFEIEKEFKIVLPDNEYNKLDTISDICNYVNGKL